MRLLKSVFQTADLDGNNELERCVLLLRLIDFLENGNIKLSSLMIFDVLVQACQA